MPSPSIGFLSVSLMLTISVREVGISLLTNPPAIENGESLGPAPGQMTVSTTYEKVSGPPRHVSVWTITQLQHEIVQPA